MVDERKIYSANRYYGLAGVLIPLIVSVPLLVSGLPDQTSRLVGYGAFWILGIILALIPLAFKLEVGKDYIKSYFLGVCFTEVHSSEVQSIQYGNLLRGGLGIGKGLNYRISRNGRNKMYSIGENFYGKEAISHVKRVLEPR